MSSIWAKEVDHYVATGHRVMGIVVQDGEIWKVMVTIDRKQVATGERDGMSAAIRLGTTEMSCACWLRRFEKDAPQMPADHDPDDDEEDDE